MMHRKGFGFSGFIRKRLNSAFNWGMFVAAFMGDTVGALIRLPVYGLFNPVSELPLYEHSDQYSKEGWAVTVFEFIANTCSSIAAIIGMVVAFPLSIVFGAVFGIEVTSIFSPKSASTLSHYINDHVMRQSVVKGSLLMPMVAALMMAPWSIVIAAAPIGALIGAVRGVSHKLYIDEVLKEFEFKCQELSKEHKIPQWQLVDKLLPLLLNAYHWENPSALAALINYKIENPPSSVIARNPTVLHAKSLADERSESSIVHSPKVDEPNGAISMRLK